MTLKGLITWFSRKFSRNSLHSFEKQFRFATNSYSESKRNIQHPALQTFTIFRRRKTLIVVVTFVRFVSIIRQKTFQNNAYFLFIALLIPWLFAILQSFFIEEASLWYQFQKYSHVTKQCISHHVLGLSRSKIVLNFRQFYLPWQCWFKLDSQS